MHMNNPPPIAAPVSAPPIRQIERDSWCRAVSADRRITSRVRLIGLCLFLADTDLTYDKIGKAAGCDRRTAIRAVAVLVDRGWLSKIDSIGRVANRYNMQMRVVAS
jgi:hypothetical protein